jgi:hypothetical protein
MKMYHQDSNYPIDVHPSRIDEMERKGWTQEPTKAQPKRKAQSKAIDTLEEINNGES